MSTRPALLDSPGFDAVSSRTGIARQALRCGRVVLGVAVGLTALGLVMLYSYDAASDAFTQQVRWVFLGAVGGTVAALVPLPWLRRFPQPSRAFASGWMRIRGNRRRRAVDRGFVLSDHSDWEGLTQTISATRAESIGLTHGYAGEMARWLREEGCQADVVVMPAAEADAGDGETS